jgi:hypothetical protein
MESLTMTAIRDSMTPEQREAASQRVAKHGPWSKQDYLLAAVVDAIRESTWVLARVNGSTVEPPKPIDRPGLQQKPSRGTPEGIALMQEILANGGGIPERFARKPEPRELEEGEGEWLDGS